MQNIASQIILAALRKKVFGKAAFDRLKRKVAGDFKSPPPATSCLNKAYHNLIKSKKIKPSKELEAVLVRRGIRSLSGIAPVTVLTKPFPCPGKCVYCPDEATMPKSYLSNEPAATRALYLKFSPFNQVERRLMALYDNGHPVDKVELIVKGGTWSSYPVSYQKWFIKRCFDAANAFGAENKKSKNLTQAQKINQRAKCRIIGLTLETRPDCVTPEEARRMRELGATRVELGVQTLDHDVLETVRRGHYTDWIAYATHLLKDAGFKVDYHMMPGLPGSTPKKDVQVFKQLFEDSRYRPDMIKIYPCVLLPNSELYEWWKRGKYRPWLEKTLINTLIKIKSLIPRYVRVSRLVRDFPTSPMSVRAPRSNLRQIIWRAMKKQGKTCQCLRCREVGHNPDVDILKIKPKLFIEKYKASGGQEYFISFEDAKRKIVFAFLRLRIPSTTNQEIIHALPEIQGCALLRELHVYGQLMSLGKTSRQAPQHQGLGKKLLKQAEKIAKQNGFKKMAVISGVGVREYYKNHGYRLKKTYMVKSL
ncbi:tRNA uridine(34) 5-carboxymethylaminomethyl modification radical SAM/GNAT enzyme Elp3 [Patescibacteria group bacterium]|nr:tRNA uridine(34) 5-carboxymethylaminomethyl modification radical SAM/GNAT enzyme Elp3 [Patescibacteria group bacterium]MBU1921991.1 tRNA uridine(34) 5-carboxymethylaminomethyl modification radical SAM/GNAT enzyme Elp3 [Patescibacteria group bacterium]